jgi:predicted metal-dependent hydrolase
MVSARRCSLSPVPCFSPMDYTVIRSQRKTLAVEITREGKILVRAPLRLACREISVFVDHNRGWIVRKLSHVKALQKERLPRQFQEGESFLFLGELHRLSFIEGGECLWRESGKFLLGRDLSAKAGALIRTWYRARAREVLEDRLEIFALPMRLRYGSVRITDARERWGSCNPRGSLSFAWRLVMAPPRIIDYVVVHELTHLVEGNHSGRFWDRVGKVLPDYRDCRTWLRENGHRLDI